MFFCKAKKRAGSSAVDPSADGLLSSYFFTYVIKHDITSKIYIGHTENIEKRVDQHNDMSFKKNSYTKLNKGNGKWVLAYSESFETRIEAKKREDELKSSRGRDFIHKQILGR